MEEKKQNITGSLCIKFSLMQYLKGIVVTGGYQQKQKYGYLPL